jgi:hypothetical protein
MNPLKRIVITGLALHTLLLPAYSLADPRWDARIDAYQHSIKDGKNRQKPSIIGDEKNISSYVNNLETLEKKTFSLTPKFVQYVRHHASDFAQLSATDDEQTGYIALKGEVFAIHDNNPTKLIRQGIDNIVDGNYQEAEALAELLELDPRLHERFFYRMSQNTTLQSYGFNGTTLLQFMATYQQIQSSPNPFPAGTRLGILNPETGEVAAIELTEAKTIYDAGIKSLSDFKVDLMKVSTQLFSSALLEEPDFFSRFHTHPKQSGDLKKPSTIDRANTFISGPNILISQDNDSLFVYRIIRGESELIYSAALPATKNTN